MSIPASAFAHPNRNTITLEIPQCFTEIIEYVYKMKYNDVVDSILLGTIIDKIEFNSHHLIHNRNDAKLLVPYIVDIHIYDSMISRNSICYGFRCSGSDIFSMSIHTGANRTSTSSGVIAWILMHTDKLRILRELEDYPSISPYDSISFIAEYKDENALHALCAYAYSKNKFSVLIDRLAMANATEETALALRWNHDMIQANISAWNNQQDKFEL